MRPICVKCRCLLVKELSGVLVAELYLKNTRIYKLWYADFFRCPICRVEIVHDFADNPFWQCHEKNRDQQKSDAIVKAVRERQYYEVTEGP